MKHILLVDDDKFYRTVARDVLKEEYEISEAVSGSEAIAFLEAKSADLILLDFDMPSLSGMETLRKIKMQTSTKRIPVIFLTAISDNQTEAECIKNGADDYIQKPFYAPTMLMRIRRVIELEELRGRLEGLVAEKTKEVQTLTLQTITSFANSIDSKDSYTKYHSKHVARLARRIAINLGFSEQETKDLYYAALLHDIGKIGVPDYIIQKPDKLTADEYKIIKKHTVIGGEILQGVTAVPWLCVAAENHHEKWDGTGYPNEKKGEEIPLAGRIVGIADAVDAMLSGRSFREARSLEYAINELKRCKSKHFDPALVDIVVKILEEGTDFLKEALEEEEEQGIFTAVLNEYSKLKQIDGLTGLWNRNYIEAKVNEILYSSHREGCLVILDTDHYKRLVSLCGHVHGERLLVNLAHTIQSELGTNDYAARIGNDEFVIYFNGNTNQESMEYCVMRLMKSLRHMVESLKLPVKISLFMGVAVTTQDSRNFNTLYHNADKAHYFVKTNKKSDYYFYCEDSEFITPLQNTEGTRLTVWQIKAILGERAKEQGACRVGRNEFEVIFKLLQRSLKRSRETICMAAFTFYSAQKCEVDVLEAEEASRILFEAMEKIFKLGDVITCFTPRQYLALAVGADLEETKKMARSVLEYYETMKCGQHLKVSFEVTGMNT